MDRHYLRVYVSALPVCFWEAGKGRGLQCLGIRRESKEHESQ